MRKISILIILFIAFMCSVVFAQQSPKARQVSVDTSEFDQNLTSNDNTVQKALNTLDNLISSAGMDNAIDTADGVNVIGDLTATDDITAIGNMYISSTGEKKLVIRSTDYSPVGIEFIRNGATRTDYRLKDDSGYFQLQASENDGATWSTKWQIDDGYGMTHYGPTWNLSDDLSGSGNTVRYKGYEIINTNTNNDDDVSGAELDDIFTTNGLLKKSGTATYTTAIAGSDYLTPSGISTGRIQSTLAGNNYFNGTGNLGVGTSSPSAKLHVNGASQFDNTITAGTITSAGSYNTIGKSLYISKDLTAQTVFCDGLEFSQQINLENIGAVKTNELSANNVRVGTTATTYPVNIAKDALAQVSSSPVDTDVAVEISNKTLATSGVAQQDTPLLKFSGQYWDGAQSREMLWYIGGVDNGVGTNANFNIFNKRGAAAINRILSIDTGGQFESPIKYAFYNAGESLGSSSYGFQLSNSAPATVSLDQNSPMTLYYSPGWKTASTAASQNMALGYINTPEQGTASPIGVHRIIYGVNNTVPSLSNELYRLKWGSDSGSLGVVFNEQSLDDYDFRIEGNSDVNLLFADGSTDRVGIGTSSPTVKLDVNGSAKVSGTMTTTDVVYIGSTGSAIRDNGGGDLEFRENYGTWTDFGSGGGGESVWSLNGTMAYYNSGNVGIGTSTPTAKLDVSGAARISQYATINGDLSAGKVLFVDESKSNVGIGKAVPVQRLDIDGNINLTSGKYVAWDNESVNGGALKTAYKNFYINVGGMSNVLQLNPNSNFCRFGVTSGTGAYADIYAGESTPEIHVTKDDTSLAGNLTVTGETHGEALINLHIAHGLTDQGSFVVSTYCPLQNFTVEAGQLCSDSQISGEFTVSLYRNGTQLTTSKTTKFNCNNTEKGRLISGLSYAFTSGDKMQIAIDAKTVASDLSAGRAQLHLWGTTKKTRPTS